MLTDNLYSIAALKLSRPPLQIRASLWFRFRESPMRNTGEGKRRSQALHIYYASYLNLQYMLMELSL